MDKGFAIIFYFGNKKVVLFWERSLRRCRRGTQKLPGKRTGFGRRSEKARRQRPTTESATSQSGGNLSGNSTGAQNRKGRFCALFYCPKKKRRSGIAITPRRCRDRRPRLRRGRRSPPRPRSRWRSFLRRFFPPRPQRGSRTSRRLPLAAWLRS